ncbi:recombinase family protein [Mesorhizobium sp.]|uniref:recombinase family protein n=1 Tax=Mesorhizobium sp. TaxID=1871066 RepID=UPI0025800818|nr:recombinase family protein [Mesorhizobium sp.]
MTRFVSSRNKLIIQAFQRSGVTSLRGIAITLNNRGVRTARGGQWQVSNVRNLLAPMLQRKVRPTF